MTHTKFRKENEKFLEQFATPSLLTREKKMLKDKTKQKHANEIMWDSFTIKNYHLVKGIINIHLIHLF